MYGVVEECMYCREGVELVHHLWGCGSLGLAKIRAQARSRRRQEEGVAGEECCDEGVSLEEHDSPAKESSDGEVCGTYMY